MTTASPPSPTARQRDSRARGDFEFEEVLPRLVAAYETGRLVPFIGSGMSRPLCADWQGFIRGLEEQAGVAISTAETKSEELVQRANFAVERLRRAAPNKLADGLRRALFRGELKPKVPMQTEALARIAWPLVLTTNYDNAYVHSFEHQHSRGGLAVVGRGTEHCQRVLNSLTTAGRSLLWALQGHLGEPFEVSTQEDDRRLSSQAVVDYSEYRRVTHREPHFRRAFAEVFRHRSLFFLGSGLRENYLQELFGEVLEIYGPSSRTHFAIMPKGEVDPLFMYERFQIAIVEYGCGEHRRVPDSLDMLRAAIERSDAVPVSWRWGRSRLVNDLVAASHDDLEIVRGPLPMKKEVKTCLAVSAGGGRRGSHFHISEKNSIRATLAKWGANVDKLTECNHHGYVGEFAGADAAGADAFAVRARPLGDRKDLSEIARAATALFNVAAKRYDCIRMQLLAAGGSASGGAPWSVRPFPPRFSFIQIVRAWGKWRRKNPQKRCRLALHVIDTALTREIASGRIDVLEILRCDDIRFWAEVLDSPDKLDRRLFQRPPEITRLRSVCDELGLSTSEWMLEVSPPPTSDANDFMHAT
jgi:hypothetical protein